MNYYEYKKYVRENKISKVELKSFLNEEVLEKSEYEIQDFLYKK